MINKALFFFSLTVLTESLTQFSAYTVLRKEFRVFLLGFNLCIALYCTLLPLFVQNNEKPIKYGPHSSNK